MYDWKYVNFKMYYDHYIRQIRVYYNLFGCCWSSESQDGHGSSAPGWVGVGEEITRPCFNCFSLSNRSWTEKARENEEKKSLHQHLLEIAQI